MVVIKSSWSQILVERESLHLEEVEKVILVEWGPNGGAS